MPNPQSIFKDQAVALSTAATTTLSTPAHSTTAVLASPLQQVAKPQLLGAWEILFGSSHQVELPDKRYLEEHHLRGTERQIMALIPLREVSLIC